MTICLKRIGAVVAAVMLASAASASELVVESSKTIAVPLSGPASSIVIGNKNIADVAVHDASLLFVTGKSYGTTNLLVFDKSGREIYNADVMVTTNSANVVTINRSGQSFTYDCSPQCRSVLSVGDQADYFATIIEQQLQTQALTTGE